MFDYHEEHGETFTSRYYGNNYSTDPTYYSQRNTFKNEYESFLQNKESLLFNQNKNFFEDQFRTFQPYDIEEDKEEDILSPFYRNNFNSNNRNIRFNSLLNDLNNDVKGNINKGKSK